MGVRDIVTAIKDYTDERDHNRGSVSKSICVTVNFPKVRVRALRER
jgi:hypothetical protein